MKVILGTSIVPTTVFIILLITIGIFLTLFPQFIYAQTVVDEIIENTLEMVENATGEEENTLQETTENSKPTRSLEITEPFQLENITTNLSNDNESAITTEDSIQTTEEAIEQVNNEAVEDQTVGVNETSSTIEQLKPVSDEMLEYLAEKFGINLSLPRETNVQILNRIFKDPEVGLQSFKNLEDAIDSLDDDPYGNQYENSSTLEEQLKLAQEKLMRIELESSSSDGIEYTVSEWGIKIKIQDPWKLSSNSNNPTNLCDNNDSSKCLIVLDNPLIEKPSSMTILAEKGQDFKDKCQCDSLLEFVQYDYTRAYGSINDFFLIGDNQTIINGNVSAWQMEYNTINKNNILNHLIVWAMAHDNFYKISYHAQKDIYSNDLPSVKEFIHSIEFIVPKNESQSLSKDNLPSFMTINNTKEEKQKQPSFMNEVEETNNRTSKLIEESTNAQDLLNIDDNQKQLQQQQQQQQQQQSNELLPDSSNNKIEIRSHDSYINSIGDMHVIGEIKNNTPNVVQYVQVIATFYDNNNKVVGTSYVYTTPSDLEPSEIAPFDLILTEASIPIEQIERYTLKVSGQ